jgi:O-succinylbenzoic acid--CoA ligase
MYKDILFLEDVKYSTRQNVLNFVKTWNSKADYITVNTSGSTGKPKEIKILKSHMKASANATVKFFDLEPGQTILMTLSAEYIAGKMLIVRAIENNLNLIIAPLSSNPLLINLNHKIHFSAFVPLQVQTILENITSKKNYELIDTVIIGGGEINQALEKKISNLTNSNFATFGMTETISHIALRNISKGEPHYTALANVNFSVNSSQCLIINAPLINSEINLQTTDIVDLLNSKQFIWKGRADFVINSGGIKLNPEILERKIESLLSNNRYYFKGEKDDLLGEKLILKIENISPLNLSELEEQLKLKLDKIELPKSILLVDQFSETKTGKLIRN